MKKSYKLLGIFWDGKPIPECKPQINIIEADNSDKEMYKLSEILLNENIDEEDKTETERSRIRIDYIPKCTRRCILDFYLCRLLQIIQYYNADIVCENEEDKERLQELIDFYYKRKTPIRLLAQSDGASQMIC